MRIFIAFVVLMVAGTGGDLAVAHASKRVGEVGSFAPAAILKFLGRAFCNGWMWIGVAQMTVAFCSLLALLSWAPVSLVVPAMALSYVTGGLGGRYLLGEQLTPVRWMGIGLVSVGVALVCIG